MLVLRELRRGGYEPHWKRVEDEASMRVALQEGGWDVILSDSSMPQFGAQRALALLRENDQDLPFIIVSGTIGEEAAVAAMRSGASDFVFKDKMGRLVPTVERELREREGREARRRAEALLRASDMRYRALFDHSPLAMWVSDRETGQFLAVNEAAVRHYGYDREEFARLTDLDLATEAEGIVHAAAPAATAASRHRTKSGAVIDVEVKAHDLEFEGRNARLIVVDDVTDKRIAAEALRAAEEQLRQSQKMEAVGRLAGGVSHDFNNILSVILSYTELLLSDPRHDAATREDLEEVRKAGKRAAALTHQLLLFSRQQVLHPTVVDLNETIGGMEKMLRRLLGDDVEVALTLAPKLGKISADSGQVEQVIVNLAVNARDAMPKGGTVRIETTNGEVEAGAGIPEGAYVVLVVSDDGCGMDAATRERIFEPFFTTKGRGKGTGLGLATVLGIVERTGGHIRVSSEVGRGTAFTLYFPRTDRPGRRPSSAPPAPRTLRGTEIVLVVEDEDQVRVVTRSILARHGYTVLEAKNAGEAFLIFEKHANVRLLLTDVVMPRISGRELVERIMPLRPELKVIYMSGYTADAVDHHGVFEAGVHYLQKPLVPDALLRKIREVLDTP